MRPLVWVALASGPAAVALWALAGLGPHLVEALYSRGLYPLVAGPWSRLWSLVPFAVTPWVAVLLVVGAGSLFVLMPPLKALAWTGAGLSVLVAWFVLGWGLNVQRPSWAELHGRPAPGGTTADLEALAGVLADKTTALWPQVSAPGPVEWTGGDVRRAVTAAYARAGAADPLLAGAWGDPKLFPSPWLLSTLGIAGVFPPFFGEPLVNGGPADWQFPFTAAHEAAHLRGFCREDEANFLAFWVLKDDPDPRLAASAWSSALLYVANALGEAGPGGEAAWDRVKARLSPAVLADWKASFAYWDRFRGPARQAAQAVNDLYLKSQGSADGVKSYGRMVDLLLAWVRPASGSEP